MKTRVPKEISAGMAFVLLRYVLIAATLYLIVVEGKFELPESGILALFAVALVSNLAATIRPSLVDRVRWFKTAVILGDTIWITLALVWSGHFGTDFVYLYFFVLLMAAIGERLSLIAVAAVVVCIGYGYLMTRTGEMLSMWDSPSLIRLPFLFTAAAFYGHLVDRIRQEQKSSLLSGTAATAKLELLATVSHEIRTPMTAILGYMHLLSNPDALARDRIEWLAILRRNSEHLMRMLDDILDFSKLEAGRMTVERTGVELVGLVTEVEATMRGRAAEKHIDLRIEYEGQIPVRIRTDATRVRQILMNLVGNAIKFTDAGSIRLVVRGVEHDERLGPTLRFDVSDTGAGISEDDQEKLFHPFSQAAKEARKGGGTGLGLAISKRLAELLDGDIVMQSTVGTGSTFTLVLPLDPGEPTIDAAIAAQSAPRPTPAPAVNPGRLTGRVLVAEDTPDNQALLTYFLGRAGLDVELADNGRIACEAAARAVAEGKPFDVILMDMQMPELDGYAATRRLRQEGYHLPILALTAYAMASDRAKCMAAGCDDFLTKPIDHEHLIGTLRKYMGGRVPTDLVASESAPAPRPSPPIELAALGMDEMIGRFVVGLQGRSAALEQGLAEDDVAALETIAHRIKGTAATFGFPELGQEAALLETAIRAQESKAAIEDLARRVIDSCKRIGTRPPESLAG